jgi:two-component system chemotaxis response regulator CheY
MLLRKIIEGGGYRTAEAGSTQEAILAYRAERPDVVTMDLLMEGHDGLVAIQLLRRIDPTAKIIVCSATTEPNYVAAANQLRVDGFLHKPVEAERLLTTIAEALAKPS